MTYRNWPIIFILIYIWVLVAGPQQRFPVLGDIRFEKILIVLSWVSLFASGRLKPRFSSLSVLIIVFFIWQLICYLDSSYKNYVLAQMWLENYWKLIVLYFLIYYSISNLRDVYVLITGFVVILGLYQIHTWLDFLQGGSYVYQQGIKRIIGIWTSGIGSANYFGMITMLSLPFAYFWFKMADNKKKKLFLIAYFGMTFASVAFSGTRGALISIVFFIFINMRGIKQISIAVIILIAFMGVTYFTLPDYLRHRYFSLVIEQNYNVEISEDAEEIQRGSAEGRLQGLIDGWKLAVLEPVTGVGPGGSPLARKRINSKLHYNLESEFQTHNLYGQVLAETGFVGTLIFMITIFTFFSGLRQINYLLPTKPHLYNYKIAVQNFILLMLFYGMASHTLYRYYWFLLFAIQGGLLAIMHQKETKLHEINP